MDTNTPRITMEELYNQSVVFCKQYKAIIDHDAAMLALEEKYDPDTIEGDSIVNSNDSEAYEMRKDCTREVRRLKQMLETF